MPVQLLRIILVIALLGVAAAIATPKGRLPLALRGIQRMRRRDLGLPEKADESAGRPVSSGRRLLAFVLVIAAVVVAVFLDGNR